MRISDWSSDVCSSDLLAALVLEVDVDVGGFVARLRQEARQQQAALDGIDRGDPEREADRGVGGRAATLAEDLPLVGEADDVLDGEEEGLVHELGDQRQFVFDLFHDLRGRTLGPAPAHAGFGELAQRSEEHTSELQSLMRLSYAVFCLKNKLTDTYNDERR